MYDQRERFLIRYLHDFDPFTVARASGAWIQTTDGQRLLDTLDEAQTGFGRLGRRFGFELYGVEPDIVSFSKTLGGGMPLAATITTSAIEEQCYHKGYMNSSSHAFDPLPAAAALAVIEEELLVEQARLRGEYLMTRLRELQKRYELIGDVRGQGLLVGVELVEDRTTKQPATALAKTIRDECLRCGLSMSKWVKTKLALTLSG